MKRAKHTRYTQMLLVKSLYFTMDELMQTSFRIYDEKGKTYPLHTDEEITCYRIQIWCKMASV